MPLKPYIFMWENPYIYINSCLYLIFNVPEKEQEKTQKPVKKFNNNFHLSLAYLFFFFFSTIFDKSHSHMRVSKSQETFPWHNKFS